MRSVSGLRFSNNYQPRKMDAKRRLLLIGMSLAAMTGLLTAACDPFSGRLGFLPPQARITDTMTPPLPEKATATATITSTATLTPLPTETPTVTPTPTERALIEGNIFYDPQTKEDFKNVVMAPSPIDKPDEFAKWQDEYLKMVMGKLENYEGPYVDLMKIGFIISEEKGSLHLFSNNWPVIASYKFLWQGQEMLTKTLVFRNLTGRVFPLTFTYTTEDRIFSFLNDFGYQTPPNDKERVMLVRFSYPDLVYEIAKSTQDIDNFSVDFMGRGNHQEIYDIFHLRLQKGTATEEDFDTLMRARLVITAIQNQR